MIIVILYFLGHKFTYTKASGHVMSINYPLIFPEYEQVDHEIRVEKGKRIVLYLEALNISQCSNEYCNSCECFIEINLGANTKKVKLCSWSNQSLTFYSYGDSISITHKANKICSIVAGDTCGYKFKYTSIPFCNHIHTDLSGAITFNSNSLSYQTIMENECSNVIFANSNKNRILLYSINWKINELISFERNRNCGDTSALKINDSYFKKLIMKPEKKKYFYCNSADGTFSINSQNNALEIQSLIDTNFTFSYEIGYVIYKYIFNKLVDEFTVDFSTSINKNAYNGIFETLEYKIVVTEDYYLVPIIYNCTVNITSGSIRVKTEKEIYPFDLVCGKNNFTVLSSMSRTIKIEFIGIKLNELRDNVRFSIKYYSLPRILRFLNGSFESFNFSTDLLSNRKQNINYTWIIDLEPLYYIKLKIMRLENCENIFDLYIKDFQHNIIYNKKELCENFIKGKHLYTFTMNKIIITFSFINNARSNFFYLPYIRCSYDSDKRLFIQKNGTIFLGNNNSDFKRHWLIKAPMGYLIVLYINQYNQTRSNGQLTFSELGREYSNNGFFHYNTGISRYTSRYDTDIGVIISNSNFMKLEYISDNHEEVLNLTYSVEKNVFKDPSGVVKPYMHSNRISMTLPRLSDQVWVIKAHFLKKIQLEVFFIDLPFGNPCSQAKLSIYDSKNKNIATFCGNSANHLIDTQSNEVKIRLSIQNEDILPEFKQVYNGFKLFYSFVEEEGDCYFQNRSNLFCNYQNIGEMKWLIRENNSRLITKDSDFNNFYCEDCFLEISSSNYTGKTAAKLLSPSIDPSKKTIKFSYISLHGSFSVTVIPNKKIENAYSLPIEFFETNQWISIQSAINESSNYQLMFEFAAYGDYNIFYAAIDSIQVFDRLLVCQSRNPSEEVGCLNSKVSSDCRRTINSCEKSPCFNNGTCIALNSITHNYLCICLQNFTGHHCELLKDPCELSLNCSKNIKCNHKNSNSNEIVKYGNQCDNQIKKCKDFENPCNELYGHGNCLNDTKSKSYSCSCDPKYTGKNCEIKVQKYCSKNSCNNLDKNAVCYDTNDSFFCRCSYGFYGTICEDIKDCSNVTCSHGGNCIDSINSFTCECSSGYIGRFCESAKICDLCNKINTLNCDTLLRKCLCHVGFTGKFCETKIDYCNPNPCVRGKCHNKAYNYECICEKDFKGTLCSIKTSYCDMNPCYNGGSCIDITPQNKIHEFSNFSCSCLSGFVGRYCQDLIDFCRSTPCRNGAKCFNELENFSCDCRNDYEGAICDTKVNDCNNAFCAYGSTCIDLIGDYRCVCSSNKYGRLCNYTEDSCLNNMCVNGICHKGENFENQYFCDCYPGYTGEYCEYEINECSSNPCRNGGNCIDLIDQYKCVCPPHYTGKNCENDLNFCSLKICNLSNTERCLSYHGGFKCLCSPGYTGLQCEIKLSSCEIFSPCKSGICRDSKTSYECINCSPGYTGKNCSNIIDFCKSSPCKYNGTCYSKISGYYCLCNNKYSGINVLSFNSPFSILICRIKIIISQTKLL